MKVVNVCGKSICTQNAGCKSIRIFSKIFRSLQWHNRPLRLPSWTDDLPLARLVPMQDNRNTGKSFEKDLSPHN